MILKPVNSSQSAEQARRPQLANVALKRLNERPYRVTTASAPASINVYDTASATQAPALALDPRDAFDLGCALINAAYRWEVGA